MKQKSSQYIEIKQEIVKEIFNRDGLQIYYNKEDNDFWMRKFHYSQSLYYVSDMIKFKIPECNNCKYFSVCMIIKYRNNFYGETKHCKHFK